MWNPNGINVFLDISTYCNAGCPQCHRTDPDKLGKAEWLPLIQWDLERFKSAFSIDEMKKIIHMKFCGTWGDPVMAKDLLEICKYVIDNSSIKIELDTNGSIRDEEWWWNLGVVCGKRLKVVFAVDGINQQMHEKYRRFTSLEKVLNHINVLSQTSARVHSQTIVFKHNQDYKKEITSLVKKYGSIQHGFVISDRFDYEYVVDNKRFFINENNEKEYLERADQESIENGFVVGTNKSVLDERIKCRWGLPRNEVVVNPDGQVLPCCYHANNHYRNRIENGKWGYSMIKHEIYADDYNKNLETYNVFHNRLSNILNTKWFQTKLPGSMSSDNPVNQCVVQCSSKIKKQHQLRVYHATK
jgi:MoaA/NifB/PqqE/SkfB family radical SAM enzyme